MSSFDAVRLTERLRRRLVLAHRDRHWARRADLRRAMEHLWGLPGSEGGLIGEPWIEPAFPAEPGEIGLRELARRGAFPEELAEQLDRTGAVPGDRPLHRFQLEALEVTHRDPRRAVVLTAPTGAGKSEAFLLPALRAAWEAEAEPGQGITCLVLYPLNALVNDQVSRLERWLAGQERLRLLHFTSETPEDVAEAARRGIADRGLHMMRSRKQGRGREDHRGRKVTGPARAPDILVTNYCMLEYMLVRPQDAAFFGRNLRAIVLDEAHLYGGALAGEIAYLLRRLCERCGV
ncbi:MAG: DEAD/DEAH box helicase, partial [Planctomycetes bacterium]|nr:DEAD/DEAH box helicase [Planctomycetota bacterium]